MSEINDLCKNIEPELLLDDLGVDYRRTTGKSGSQLNVKECPRCGGNKWKVFLNAETGLGNCFHGSCVGEPGFSMFSFAKFVLGDGSATYELLAQLSGRAGWRPKRKREKREILAPDWSQQSLMIPKSVSLPYKGKAGKYLTDRNFAPQTIEYFQWRYCHNGYFEYQAEKGLRKQDYSHRILIPIFDLHANLSTFQGRDTTGLAEKKYLFPPGLPGSSLYLYNGHNAVGKPDIVINEGVFDVAAVYQSFQEDPLLKNVVPVGTFGKVLSMGREHGDDQLGAVLILKSRGLKRITMMWDSDPTALRAAAKAALVLAKFGLEVYVATLPPGTDPNEATPVQVRESYRRAVKVTTKLEYMRFISKLPST